MTTSWDDAHPLDLRVLEMLRERGLKGTFYVPGRHPATGVTDPQVVKSLHEGGGEIGAHTLTHPDMREVPLDQAREEALGSKLWLEEMLGADVVSFCYPKGFHDPAVVEAVRTLGFHGARTTRYDRLALPADRFRMGISVQAADASPLLVARTWMDVRGTPRALWDWEARAKSAFDAALRRGGVWHLWGHSWEIDANGDWERLARVLDHVAGRPGVEYATNGDVLGRLGKGGPA